MHEQKRIYFFKGVTLWPQTEQICDHVDGYAAGDTKERKMSACEDRPAHPSQGPIFTLFPVDPSKVCSKIRPFAKF